MKKQVVKELSELIYNLFVVNSSAAGIQQKNGAYITKYIPISPMLIERMILSNGSMGCYQQGMNTGYIKWICFDFDCKDKNNPDVEKLDNEIIKQLTDYLDSVGINYIKEFSGRRGIHVWIIFDCIIKKSTGYHIEQAILREINLDNDGTWGLDLFPATANSKGNKVGKQVKFPLSSHRMGSRSFFYNGKYTAKEDVGSEDFFKSQNKLLYSYKRNSVEDVLIKLKVEEYYEKDYSLKYKKYRVFGEIDITTEEVISILSETQVFKKIFDRMRNGQALPQDWIILMGTLSWCDDTSLLLRSLFEQFPNYDRAITESNISKLKDKYYPATFGYLYDIYNLTIEEWLDPETTGLFYIAVNLGIEEQLKEKNSLTYENKPLLLVEDTVNKEQEYIQYNDETVDIYIWNTLRSFKTYDIKIIEEEISRAKQTGNCEEVEGFRVFERIESEEKTRTMVALSAKDRVITTHLALLLYNCYRHQWNSFSYRPLLTSKKDIFYAWYNSWGNYIRQISSFIEVPFFRDYEVAYIDIKSFYDKIDFLTVLRTVNITDNQEALNIMHYLLGYNDKVMKSINDGKRIGVPQGPAYARIISELFLSNVLEKATERVQEYVKTYRYVDDIVVIIEPGHDAQTVYDEICKKLELYGLPINTEKSQKYGKIGSLSEDEIAQLLHSDSFNYDLRLAEDNDILLASEREAHLNRFINEHDFEMGMLGYIFSDHTLSEAKRWCFNEKRKEIFSSSLGRGINYRRFYEYILVNEFFVNRALDEKLLHSIPVNSLNFCNFIDQLYLLIQQRKISPFVYRRIQNEYLKELNIDDIEFEEKAVVMALLMIDTKGYSNE